jgi:hypothetical protein
LGFGIGQQVGRNIMGGGNNNRNNNNWGNNNRNNRNFNNNMGGGRGGRRGCGCGTIIGIEVIIIIVVIFVALQFIGGLGALGIGSRAVPPSTVERVKISHTCGHDTLVYYDDTSTGDWFTGAREMENGARAAHNRTGVKYGIYVTDIYASPGFNNVNALTNLADALYEEWFGDCAGHLMLAFIDLGDGSFLAADIIGGAARTVYDNEAIDILAGYIRNYWDQPDRYDESQMFGKALENSAERIMSVTKTPFQIAMPWIFGLLAIVAVFIGVNFAIRNNTKRKQAAADAARADAELLNTPLAGLDGTPQADPLLEKYNNPEQD